MKIPGSAHPNVRAGIIQCYFCGGWGHSYRDNNFKPCTVFFSKKDRTRAHYNDWRKLENSLSYSLNVLYPNHTRASIPKVNTTEVESSKVPVSVMALNSEGINLPDNISDIPTEYLFDGGATNSVSNNLHIPTNYKPLPQPIPIHTATHDCSAVIVGEGKLPVMTEKNAMESIEDVYYRPKATATIISPGALIAKGPTLMMNEKHRYWIKLKSGKSIRAYHKNKRWFINPQSMSTSNKNFLSLHAMTSNTELSRLWHNCFGHVSMRQIWKLFKEGGKYGLPDVTLSDDVVCEDCLKCKSHHDWMEVSR